MKRLAGVGLSFFILSVSLGCPLAKGQSFFFENPSIGETAKSFTLKTVGGGKVSLDQYRNGKKAIVFFWATWCPHCREAIIGLNRSKKELEAKDIKVVLVDIGEAEAEVKRYVDSRKVEYDVFLDHDSSVAEAYGIIGVPTFYLINKQGVIQDVQHGLPENYEEILSRS